jgi:plasmid maintenance system antidote protein VapI
MREGSRVRTVGRSLYERLSFHELYESQAWKQILEESRPNLSVLRESAQDLNSSSEFSQAVRFVQDGEIDEGVIMSRFRDYLLINGDPPRAFNIPLPGLVLREFLNAFGALELSFWRKLPLRTIERVIDGEIPISFGLSNQLSQAFGTRSGFWRDMQTEYDRRESGSIGCTDSDS